jgi:hypothetical protein
MTALLWLDRVDTGAFFVVEIIVITGCVILANLLTHWFLTPRQKVVKTNDGIGLEILEPPRRHGSTWNDHDDNAW